MLPTFFLIGIPRTLPPMMSSTREGQGKEGSVQNCPMHHNFCSNASLLPSHTSIFSPDTRLKQISCQQGEYSSPIQFAYDVQAWCICNHDGGRREGLLHTLKTKDIRRSPPQQIHIYYNSMRIKFSTYYYNGLVGVNTI